MIGRCVCAYGVSVRIRAQLWLKQLNNSPSTTTPFSPDAYRRVQSPRALRHRLSYLVFSFLPIAIFASHYAPWCCRLGPGLPALSAHNVIYALGERSGDTSSLLFATSVDLSHRGFQKPCCIPISGLP